MQELYRVKSSGINVNLKKQGDVDRPTKVGSSLIFYIHHSFAHSFISRCRSTPLLCATGHGNTEQARVLINIGGADVNVYNVLRCDPLFLAAKRNNVDLVRLLLNNKAKLDHRTGMEGVSALYVAAHFGYTKLAQLLIER